ncbi:MAG TPA: hypothetical protein VJT69_01070 [Pyrinomonadaceae bacterium]|nr:hypothetical protein [Pyrinomonadaceae bacterium]
MKKHKHLATLSLLCLAFLSFGIALNVKTQVTGRKAKPDFKSFPIVDFNKSESTEPDEKAKRQKKDKRYSERYLPAINETSDELFSSRDWDRGLPALPIKQSAAIIIGTVTSAEAHLTQNRTSIYSEFAVSVDTVVKNEASQSLQAGSIVSLERKGGRVRMPSGKIVVSWTRNQNMPEVGSRYALFLTHDFEVKGDVADGFYLLTGYELRSGRVFPLDANSAAKVYTDRDESVFLNDLLSALATPPTN